MEWRDQGMLLSSRPHGETSVIAEVFTEAHGRHAGVIRGGTSRKLASALQPGNTLDVTWRGRLEEHLGTFGVEPVGFRAAALMDDRLSLAGIGSIAALLKFCLPEREPHPSLYAETQTLVDLLAERPEGWPRAYLDWEVALLRELGFGLDLSECAVLGGAATDLTYVSPKTGRAVSRKGAGDWAPKLIPLPPALMEAGGASNAEVAEGLEVTGHFLSSRVAAEIANRPLPGARERFVAALRARR